MKKWGALIPALFAGLLIAGCTSKDSQEVTVRYLNFKPEVADVWKEIAEVYTEETGVNVEIITAPSNCNEQTLKAEIAKKNYPTLFQINGPVGYANWEPYCAELSDTDLYSWVLDKDMCVTGEDGGVYGIPYVVEGYGIIYNEAIMQKYYALANKATDITSTDQINSFEILKAVADDMQANKEALGIDGVFASTSFESGEEWRWQTHLMNLPVYYEYQDKGVNDLDQLEFTYSQNYKNIFDLYITDSTCQASEIGSKSVEDSMTEFALGQCAMVQNGNWAWTQIESVDGNVVEEDNCKFLPIYIGAEGEESQGICIGTECYMAVNSIATEEEQQAAIDFLEWIFSSDTGKEYVKDKFQFITVFSTFDETADVPENPLAQEVSKYINDTSKKSVSWNFTTFPSQTFKDGLAEHLYSYAAKGEDYSEVENYVVSEWQAEKAEE